MIELKPCPFCGGRLLKKIQMRKPLPDFEEIDPGNYAIACMDCRCLFYFERSANETIETWNRRADNG